MRTPLMFPVVLLSLTACAAPSATGEAHFDPEVILRTEIEQEGPSSAYVLVEKVRPNWLRWRGSTSFTLETDVIVYLDGTRLGGREELRNIATDVIQRLEHLDARLATARYGVGHVQGAILVTTSR